MKKLILSITFFVITSTLFSQSVTVYEPYTKKTKDQKTSKSSIKHNFQWNWSLITRGAFVVNYEYKINNYLSAEAGLGLTYVDLMSIGFYERIVQDEEVKTLDEDESAEIKGGYYASAAIKIYPKEMEDFEGLYIQPTIRYRTYNLGDSKFAYYDSSIGNNINEKSFTINYKATDLALMFGYQIEGWQDIMYNTYIGLGYTMKTIEHPVANTTTKQLELGKTYENIPNVFVGFSLGLTF